MAVRYISKGKGKNRKVFPLSNRKKGVSIRSVSLQPKAVLKINKEQIKLLNRGQSSTFSKALNQVVMRAKRAGIPIYDSNVNTDGKTKPYHMWITDMKSHKKVKRSDTMVLAKNYGQAVDDYITIWNKENRMNMDIGYPVVQGTGLHPIKNKAEDVFITEDSTKRKKRERYGRDEELEFHPFNIQISDPEGKNTTFVNVQATDEDTAIAKAKFSGQQKLNTKDVKIVKISRGN